ncbi:hypothetical protein ACFQZC_36540 [Streptacidiphilus monticola]
MVDPEAAAQLETTNRQRLEGQSRIAGVLADRGALAEDVDQRRAADLIYLLMSPEVHRILTVERGWSPEAYERWLATSLRASLLP